MEFTGERFHPDGLREIWYEHYHRYAVARNFVRGERVLDLACGEGYGSAMLARRAAEVIGVDASLEAVEHARATYAAPNLRFEQGRAESIDLPDASVDRVISFETIEHLEPQEAMLDEFARVLSEDGVLVISSPDRKTYSDERDYHNEFHVRELYRAEFETQLAARFPFYRMLGQKLIFASLIWDPNSDTRRAEASMMARGARDVTPFEAEPLYWIAICARHEESLRQFDRDLWLFMDPEESVYRHYYHEIRKNMEAGGIIAERDARIAELEAQLVQARDEYPQPPAPWWKRWRRR